MATNLEKIEQLFGPGFTQSEITTWDQCQQKWQYRYFHRLQPLGSWSWTLEAGHLWHYLMEQGYRYNKWTTTINPKFFHNIADKDTDILKSKQWLEQELYWRHVLQILRDAYHRQHKDLPERPKAVEVILKAEFEGILFTGKADIIGERGKRNLLFLLDFKTCKNFSDRYDQGWEFKFQFLWYVWLHFKESGEIMDEFTIRLCRKPGLRLKNGETTEAFTQRACQDILQNEQDYFKDYTFNISEKLLADFEHNVIFPKIDRIRYLRSDPEVFFPLFGTNRNTNACYDYGKPCEFLPLCKHGNAVLHDYKVRDHKHSEIEE